MATAFSSNVAAITKLLTYIIQLNCLHTLHTKIQLKNCLHTIVYTCTCTLYPGTHTEAVTAEFELTARKQSRSWYM